jgi:flagellar biosynthesis protein FliP
MTFNRAFFVRAFIFFSQGFVTTTLLQQAMGINSNPTPPIISAGLMILSTIFFITGLYEDDDERILRMFRQAILQGERDSKKKGDEQS